MSIRKRAVAEAAGGMYTKSRIVRELAAGSGDRVECTAIFVITPKSLAKSGQHQWGE